MRLAVTVVPSESDEDPGVTCGDRVKAFFTASSVSWSQTEHSKPVEIGQCSLGALTFVVRFVGQVNLSNDTGVQSEKLASMA